ncbi:MAG TPA: hypothetical protein VH740_23895 [Vicinamibacterales bacterium]|jgi:hypothetical protein
MEVLVIDVGGTHIKVMTSGCVEARRAESGADLTPSRMVERVHDLTLFLGLGTGLGSALVSEHIVVPLELGTLRIATASRWRNGSVAPA